MASALPLTQLPSGFHLSNSTAQLPSIFPSSTLTPKSPLTTRFKKVIRSQLRQRLIAVLASNSNPQGEDSIKETSDNLAGRDAPQGPPFLTILAGLVVFLLVCWLFGSIVMSLFGLIFKLTSSK